MKKLSWHCYLGLGIIGAIILTLAIVFFFKDLDISIALTSGGALPISRILGVIGPLPIYVGPILFGLAFGFTASKTLYKWIFHGIGAAGGALLFAFTSKDLFSIYYSSKLSMSQYLILALAGVVFYGIIAALVFNFAKYEALEKLKDAALVYLIVSAVSFAGCEFLKRVWGRTRFFALGETYSDFTNFLTVKGFSSSSMGDGYRSFPSGHVTSASTSLVLLLIPINFTKKRWPIILVGCLAFLYTLIVAITRINMSAHYASDVLFGFVLTSLVFVVTFLILYKKRIIYDRDK